MRKISSTNTSLPAPAVLKPCLDQSVPTKRLACAVQHVPSRGKAAKQLVNRATVGLPALPKRQPRNYRPAIEPDHRNYLMEGGAPAVARHLDGAARTGRRKELEQKHLDDADALLKEMTSPWEPKALDTKVLRAELRPNRDHLFAGSRIPLARPIAHQPANAQPATRNGNRAPGITKSPKGAQPRLRTEVHTSPRTNPQSKND